MTQIFDIETPEDAFHILDKSFKTYCSQTAKSAEEILLILMLTNHLREWIAPNYDPKKGQLPPPKTPEQTFSKEVYEHPDFSIIRQLCNGAKHANRKALRTTVRYEEDMHAWSDLHKVKDMRKGEAVSYVVDGKSIESIIEPIIEKYRNWFS